MFRRYNSQFCLQIIRSSMFSDGGRVPAIVGRRDRRRSERDTREGLR
jgi:hypothetical protein